MSQELKQTKTDPVSNRKILDRAFILPLLGLVLLLSPLAKIFQIDRLIAGIPFTIVYLFVVWGLLIAGAVYLARKLGNPQFDAGSNNAKDEIEQ